MVGSFSKLNRFNYPPVDDLFTAKMGIVYPVRCISVLPGDTWKIDQSQMARMLALLSPAYGKVCMRLHTFFVPYRVLWPEFYEGFMIQKLNDDGTLADPSVIPTITKNWTVGSLGDYLGYPVGTDYTSTAFKVRAYQKIIRDWYLNTNIEQEYDIALSTQSGADTTTSTELFHSNYPRDYFTGTYPTRQRGEELPVPITSGSAPVSVFGNGNALMLRGKLQQGVDVVSQGFARMNDGGSGHGYSFTTSGVLGQLDRTAGAAVTGDLYQNGSPTLVGVSTDQGYGDTGLVGVANLQNISSVNPSDFRLVWQMNLKRQKDLYAGSRTVDWLQEHYGVRCPDARLQRSEFLGGQKTYFNVSEVLQTSATSTGTTAQGNMAGHGFSVSAGKSIKKTFTEHGVIMTLLTITPQAVYMQGSPREDMKRSPEEFGLPVLSHTIMDAVYKGQVFWTGTDTDKQPLGYRNIYDEYRVMYSSAKGLFRPGQSLEYWTWARKFANQPALNKQFIQVENNERPFATQDGSDKFLVKVVTKAKAYRKLPKVGTPMYLDHA
uniref:Major capsid protein n=1 Tax=Dulem virus 98 TaxID=3145809 RepID=A0AAU8B703_9VIRU